MDKKELARRIMATFLEELDEHVSTLNRDLLALEKNPESEDRLELLHSLFRAAHSLKGASRAVNVELIEKACHSLEDLLVAVRDRNQQLQTDHYTLLFRLADAIEEAGMRLREDQSLDDAPIAALLPKIDALDKAAQQSESAESSARTKSAAAANLQQPVNPTDQSRSSAQPASVQPKPGSSASVRIDAKKLDALLAQAGELLVARQRIELGVEELQSLRDSIATWRRAWRAVDSVLRGEAFGDRVSKTAWPKAAYNELTQTADKIHRLERSLEGLLVRARGNAQYLEQVGTTLEGDVHGARMLPFTTACQGLERAIRDVSAQLDKRIQLVVMGGDVQVDRSVLERLKDPLLHLVRNSADHGIETPQQRKSAGKSELATITVQAALHGGSVQVSVRDDGGGIELDRIREKANAAGIQIPQEVGDVARLIFRPAFSTAASVSDLSGRGVGLDVVRSQIEQLHGTVDVSFQPGSWTCFTLTVPLTLTTIRAVMVKAAGQTYAIPTASIDRILRFGPTDHATVGGRSVVHAGGTPIALTGLARTLGLTRSWELSSDRKMFAAVLNSGQSRTAFAVDEVTSEVELTVKSLGPRVRQLAHVSGATLLASGEIALVLNAANLMRTAAGRAERYTTAESKQSQQDRRRRLLVVDDSITSRMLLRSILDASGYEVSVAADGQQATEMVASMAFDLVVSDVDMPRLDGFQFTEQIRKTSSGANLPIVLVTARGSEEDRIRGLKAGANAYLVKSGFDQSKLLNVIEELL